MFKKYIIQLKTVKIYFFKVILDHLNHKRYLFKIIKFLLSRSI